MSTARVIWIGTINKQRIRIVADGGPRSPYLAVERMGRDQAGGARWDYLGGATSAIVSDTDRGLRNEAVKMALATLPTVRGGRRRR